MIKTPDRLLNKKLIMRIICLALLPGAVVADENLPPGLRVLPPTQISADLRAFIAHRAQPALALYSADTCVYCRQAKAYLDARAVPYNEYNIDHHLLYRQTFEAMGGVGVPLITVGGDRVQGFQPELLEHVLQRNGYFNPNPQP
jgi:glutaredoxin